MDTDKFVLNTVKKRKYIVHGGQALNRQLPPNLYRPTKDWDLWTKNPQQAMDKLEDELDKEAGGDYFYEGTLPLSGSWSGETVYRVISRITGEAVAEFMKTPNHKNLYDVIGGIRWETLEHAKMVYEKILRDPLTKPDRKAKSRRDLNRILAFERQLESGKVGGKQIPNMFKFAPVRFAPVRFAKPIW